MMKELIRNYKQATQAVEQEQISVKKLKAKCNDLGAKIPALREAVAQAETARLEAMDGFVRDLISQPELDAVKANHAAAQTNLTDAEDLLEAATSAKNSAARNIPPLSQKMLGMRHKFFTTALEKRKLEFQTAMAEEFERLVALDHSKAYVNYDGFLKSLFPKPSHERIRELQSQLVEEYGL